MFGQQLPPPFPTPQQQQQQQPQQQLQQPPPNALPAAHVCQNLICSKFLKYLFSKSKKKYIMLFKKFIRTVIYLQIKKPIANSLDQK